MLYMLTIIFVKRLFLWIYQKDYWNNINYVSTQLLRTYLMENKLHKSYMWAKFYSLIFRWEILTWSTLIHKLKTEFFDVPLVAHSVVSDAKTCHLILCQAAGLLDFFTVSVHSPNGRQQPLTCVAVPIGFVSRHCIALAGYHESTADEVSPIYIQTS